MLSLQGLMLLYCIGPQVLLHRYCTLLLLTSLLLVMMVLASTRFPSEQLSMLDNESDLLLVVFLVSI